MKINKITKIISSLCLLILLIFSSFFMQPIKTKASEVAFPEGPFTEGYSADSSPLSDRILVIKNISNPEFRIKLSSDGLILLQVIMLSSPAPAYHAVVINNEGSSISILPIKNIPDPNNSNFYTVEIYFPKGSVFKEGSSVFDTTTQGVPFYMPGTVIGASNLEFFIKDIEVPFPKGPYSLEKIFDRTSLINKILVFKDSSLSLFNEITIYNNINLVISRPNEPTDPFIVYLECNNQRTNLAYKNISIPGKNNAYDVEIYFPENLVINGVSDGATLSSCIITSSSWSSDIYYKEVVSYIPDEEKVFETNTTLKKTLISLGTVVGFIILFTVFFGKK